MSCLVMEPGEKIKTGMLAKTCHVVMRIVERKISSRSYPVMWPQHSALNYGDADQELQVNVHIERSKRDHGIVIHP